MSRNAIHHLISGLACSHGFYGRLMAGCYGDYDAILDWLAYEVRPSDDLDVVMALEG